MSSWECSNLRLQVQYLPSSRDEGRESSAKKRELQLAASSCT